MKIPSRWSNFFYTIFAFLMLFILALHIKLEIFDSITIYGSILIGMLLSASQFAFAFKEGKHDYFAALSGINLLYSSAILFMAKLLPNNFTPFLIDAGVLIGLISISFIWVSSEGFSDIIYFINRKKQNNEEVKVESIKPNAGEGLSITNDPAITSKG